ncbi:MAG: STAS/SEC14 domain-containing protein [Desulfobacteraceae bacterium]|nr:STAS/SEC14 domain-containing protein [Desulfobacteraceae bacterium]
MTIEASFHSADGYLLASIRGKWTEDSVKEQIDNIKCEAERREQTRVLLDMREILPPQNGLTRFLSGKEMARVWGSFLKVAAIWKTEFITKFAEYTAMNRGADFAIFSDEKEAKEWLMEGPNQALNT